MSNLFYTDKGSGFPVVFIHGFCESGIIWKDLSEHLQGSFRVLCPDLPGFGKSPLPLKEDFSLEDIAQEIIDWLDHLNIHECVVIGHSLGGYITLALNEKFPKYFSGFGLFHSTCFPDEDDKKKTRNKVIDYINTHGSNEFTETFVPGLFYRKSEEIQKDIERLILDARSIPNESIIAYTKAMRDRPGRCHLLQKSAKPILFIAGEKDGAVPIETSRIQTKPLNPEFVHFLAGTGHMGMYEKKSETLIMVSDFLQQFSIK